VRIIRWLNHDISILREKLLQSLRYQEESTWEKTGDTRSIENELISKSLSVVSTPLRLFAENWSNFGTLFILAIIIQICILFVVYADGIFYYAALFGIAVSSSAAIRTLSGITLPFEVNREMEEEEIRKIQQDAVAERIQQRERALRTGDVVPPSDRDVI
jgi:hypothetical protein